MRVLVTSLGMILAGCSGSGMGGGGVCTDAGPCSAGGATGGGGSIGGGGGTSGGAGGAAGVPATGGIAGMMGSGGDAGSNGGIGLEAVQSGFIEKMKPDGNRIVRIELKITNQLDTPVSLDPALFSIAYSSGMAVTASYNPYMPTCSKDKSVVPLGEVSCWIAARIEVDETPLTVTYASPNGTASAPVPPIADTCIYSLRNCASNCWTSANCLSDFDTVDSVCGLVPVDDVYCPAPGACRDAIDAFKSCCGSNYGGSSACSGDF